MTSSTPGAAKLAFTVSPGNAVAGTAITPVVTVAIQDANGGTATNATDMVTVAIGANPGAATLAGTVSVAAVGGIATFANLSLDKAGIDYTLTASAQGLTSATSGTFAVNAGPPTQLAFTTQPTNTVARDRITVQVTASDAYGNTATGFGGNVTVTIGTNPAHGALSGTLTVAAVAGIATFSTLTIDSVGTGYTLMASAAGIAAAATSVAFNVATAVGRLAFTVQPSNTIAGNAISPSVAVTIRDLSGNTLTNATNVVTVVFDTNPGPGTLGGTTSVAAANGVATFSTLQIAKSAARYRLRATASGFISATSASFDITAGPAAELVFTTQPTSTTVGAAITPPVQVTARDAVGNTASGFTGAVTVTIGDNPGGSGLAGTTTRNATAGVATFADLSLDSPGVGYSLVASSGSLAVATSDPFTISALAGALRITTATTGPLPPSRYVVCIDLNSAGDTCTGGEDSIGVNATLTVSALTGPHLVQLNNVPPNCTVAGDNPRVVQVSGMTDVPFSITCAAAGSVRVTTTTTGTDPDPNGYVVCIDLAGDPCNWSGDVATNGTVTISGVTTGAHTVELDDVSTSCTVTGGTTRMVTVPASGIVDVSFAITCMLAERIAYNDGGTITLARVDGLEFQALIAGATPAWSPNGARLAYECGQNICAINADSTGFAQLTADGASNRHPTWSTDGSRIAFSATHSGVTGLWVMAANGSGAVQVTQATGFRGSPAWSPIDNRIVYDCQITAGNDDLCVVNADGTGFVRLTNATGTDHGAAWKRDGSTLAFSTTRFLGTDEIVLMSAAGGTVTRIGLGLTGFAPTWSPDGSQLAFVDTDGTNDLIFITATDGSEPLGFGIFGDQPSWRPHPTGSSLVRSPHLVRRLRAPVHLR